MIMQETEIKIFYSWQSDLPGNTTRNLIQSSIDDAVKSLRGTVSINADRDTKGEYGTPDITQTIFAKIEDCDIFIADVSVVNKYYSIDNAGNKIDAIKLSPNPNVLLELGYAASVVSWENVICIINTDYGEPSDLPFDIAHRRLTPYSLINTEKADVRKYLRRIIADTVMNLLENGKRTKRNFANLVVGSFNFDNKEIQKNLLKWIPNESPEYNKEKTTALNQCKTLVSEISSIKLDNPTEKSAKPIENGKVTSQTLSPFEQLRKNINTGLSDTIRQIKIKDSDIENTSALVKEYLALELPKDFFTLGNLKQQKAFLAGQPSEEIGTSEEKEKYHKIIDLEYYLHRIHVLDMYAETFSPLYLFPLAIQNISTIADKDISITIQVNSQTAETVLPDAKLINPELQGIEGLIYEEQLIKKALLMPDTADIQYDSDISYNPNDITANIKRMGIPNWYNTTPNYDEHDYAREIAKYIATPLKNSSNTFDFYIRSLRPKEISWLGASILLRAKTDEIKLTYTIKSQHSNGELSGNLRYVVQ